MPVNYNVNGNVAVSQAVDLGRHDWSPLHARLENDKRREEAKAAAIQAEIVAKTKQASEEAKYNVDGIKDPVYNQWLQEDVDAVTKHAVNGLKSGTTGSIQHNTEQAELVRNAERRKATGEASLSALTNTMNDIDKWEDWTDKDAAKQAAWVIAHPQDRNVNPEDVAKQGANKTPYINTSKMYGSKIKSFGDATQRKDWAFPIEDPNNPSALRNQIGSDMTKAKFFKPVVGSDNKIKLVPGVSDDMAQFLLNTDKDLNADAQHQYDLSVQREVLNRLDKQNPNQEHSEQEIQDMDRIVRGESDAKRFLLNHVINNLEAYDTPTRETDRKTTVSAKPGGSEEEKVTVTRSPDKEYNVQVPKERGGEGILKAWSPDTYELTGKGLDKGVDVNIEKYINADENKIEKPVGSQELYPNRLVLVPWTMQKGKKVIMADDKAEVLQRIKKGEDINFEWRVEGKVKYKKENGLDDNGNPKYITTEKNISVPYEDVKEKIGSHTGFDLSNRDLKDVSDFELIATIKKNNPKATPEQRVAIFKKLRGQ